MLFLIWLVLCLGVLSVILLFPAIRRREIYRRYSGSRLVACPENQQAAVVSVDLRHAAATAMVDGPPDLRLCDCTRWPERSKCGQGCLSQAVQTEPNVPGEAKPGTRPIHHLPVLVAAFAAWGLGAIWHAQYLFRAPWMDGVGLRYTQVSQIKWWYAPHLLTVAVWLLFAYGVAWLLAVCHRKGVVQGVLMAVLLCGAVAAANWYGIAELPHDLLAIEAGYIGLATLIVGAIVGGLEGKLAPSQ